jgi:hypothetical protein
MRPMERLTIACLTAFALAACTPERGPIGHLNFPGEGGTDYRIGPDGISNARLSVSRVENGKTFRGLVGANEELEIRLEAGQLKGERGSNPVLIQVTQQGNEITARGLYGGKNTAIHILSEPPNLCAYRFDEREGGEPPSTCGGQRSLALPPFMASWSKEEQALFVTIAFAEVSNGPSQLFPHATGYGVNPGIGSHGVNPNPSGH